MNAKKRLLWLALLGLFILVLIGGWFFFKPSKQTATDQVELKDDPQAVTYDNKIKKPPNYDVTQLVFPGYDDITVREGAEKAYVSLANPEFNKASFTFIISYGENNEVLLETGLVKPGKTVNEFPLPKALKPGHYQLKMKIEAFDLTTQKQLNGASTSVELVVIEKGASAKE
ncbi:hypothetical protein [Enterococcus sp. DIV1420a]|uniref:hypothetical protein n=1 Tax=Enterococcus sp. DIV1420a TaxID=2774672 RepID=UPI003F24C58E